MIISGKKKVNGILIEKRHLKYLVQVYGWIRPPEKTRVQIRKLMFPTRVVWLPHYTVKYNVKHLLPSCIKNGYIISCSKSI